MNQQENYSVAAMKAKADTLGCFLEGKGVQLQRTALLEAVAQMCGFANWSTARAAAPKPPKAEKPKASDGLQDFEVTVVRIGYASTTIEDVVATSRAKAADSALEEADLVDFSEHHADYCIEGNEPEEEPDATYDTTDDTTDGPEKTYTVEVGQINYGSNTLTVRAVTRAEAEEKALDEAGNHYFSMSGGHTSVLNLYAAD